MLNMFTSIFVTGISFVVLVDDVQCVLADICVIESVWKRFNRSASAISLFSLPSNLCLFFFSSFPFKGFTSYPFNRSLTPIRFCMDYLICLDLYIGCCCGWICLKPPEFLAASNQPESTGECSSICLSPIWILFLFKLSRASSSIHRGPGQDSKWLFWSSICCWYHRITCIASVEGLEMSTSEGKLRLSSLHTKLEK